MAMFGAIIFIPLYLQLVYGASPTGSGLRMLPLMAGLLVAAIASGRMISRIGRYKVFPVAGTAILDRRHVPAVAAGRRHRAPGSPRCTCWWSGVGIGLVMQVLVLVVQNDAPPKDIGVVTSTATFFRSVGGSFGVAVFGAIFASRLSSQLAALPASVTAHLGGGVHLNPQQADALPPAVHRAFLHAFAHALHGAFIWGMVIAAVPFLLSWLLKEVPLRTTLGPRTAELSAEQAACGGTPDERQVVTERNTAAQHS